MIVSVARENQLLSIIGKHRKSIEITFSSNLFKSCSVGINHKKIEVVASAAVVVRRENNFLSSWMKKWCSVRLSQLRNLFEICSVYITSENFHVGGCNQSLTE